MNKGDRIVARSIIPGVPNMVVVFKGFQETGFPELPGFGLYDLTADLPGHTKHSTVSKDTIEGCGYVLPDDAV